MLLEHFQMVDRITALDLAARTVRAECAVPDASPVFEGHFPGYPILPGVLMIEAMAQTGGWLIMALHAFERMAFLAQVKEAKMRAFVGPGEKLIAESTIVHDGSGYAISSAQLLRDGRGIAEAEITFRVMPFPNPMLRAQLLESARRVQIPVELIHG
jgi:3-hydroxyacyl-[acyl-carrier-protein] dehydratase